MKKDVYPGLDRKVWFIPNHIGSYIIYCAEYCGMNHSAMLSQVIVMTQTDFDNWKNAGSSEEPGSSDGGNEKESEEIKTDK